jgi:hypothetical protein
LLELDCRTAQLGKRRGDENFIIEHGGAQEVDRDADHRELQSALGPEPWLVDAEGPQPFTAAAL